MLASERTSAQPAGRTSVRPAVAPAAQGIGLKIPPRDGCVWHPCDIDIDNPVTGLPIVGRWASVPPASE